MKIPSFLRLPKNNRFNFEPRYYDPIKEEIEQRTNRIKIEIEGENSGQYRSSISSAFKRKHRQQKQSSIIQYVLIIFMILTVVGYLYYGNVIFYSLLLIVPFYFWMKMRRRS